MDQMHNAFHQIENRSRAAKTQDPNYSKPPSSPAPDLFDLKSKKRRGRYLELRWLIGVGVKIGHDGINV
ncbi:hypothetical protein F2Q69_00053569 [Brassica cretica]|uniref:Uncharacterized protein n=1 Tax=Brassica cretica TaxID=69181 RepID=A0A8S9MPF4_BRACR|nr:hypothetical protein F2Q69_00053569 [Brassica cretica]